ncbi:hypothetical protein HNO88_004456 [Novosphingobium chloroacetimidivorans]|uniref:Uncharacterized protein n=1 Tax=Novosphingobium chloroacetimidivorans TaxID=1428314 RepID=A0A7W7KE11_9SPHN|nr:hypothetical protein [Novosphingobium chloroacetimidivorans]
MYQVEVLRGKQWCPAGAHVREPHAIENAKNIQRLESDVRAVRVLDLAGWVIYSR